VVRPAKAPALRIVALGDSIIFGEQCEGCSLFVDQYAAALSDSTGRKVRVNNLSVPGTEVAQLKEAIPSEAFRRVLVHADGVVITVGGNDLPFNRSDDPCHVSGQFPVVQWDQLTRSCTRHVARQFSRDLDAVLTEIATIRHGKPTLVRVTTMHNYVIGDHVDPGWDAPDAVAPAAYAVDVLDKAQCAVARAHDAKCADTRRAVNGKSGREDAAPFLAQDHCHLSQAGHNAYARALIASGFDPIGAVTSRARLSVHGATHHKSQNGPIALSVRTIADGSYGPQQIATVRKNGGPYHFLTNQANDALNPDFTPDGTRILFWSIMDSGPDTIFSVPVQGGAVTEVQTGCAHYLNCLGDDNPAVSPDGKELLAVRAVGPFDGNGCLAFVGIFKFRIDGSHARQITPSIPGCNGDFWPRWSPDGRKIVFQHADSTGFRLWVMNSDGSDRRQITPTVLNNVGNPDWSPDGRRILFQSPDENPFPDEQNPQQLFTIHPDGTGLVQLTNYGTEPGLIIGTNGARWSPDGRKIVFAHRDATTTVGPDGLHHQDLFVMNPDGSHVVQINATPEGDNMQTWGVRTFKNDK
jgi:Tol biopolymer transport system component/lysophospholipase L1-like esterase